MRLADLSGESDGVSGDTETPAAFVQVLLVGSYARDGASDEQLHREFDLALSVIRE